MGKETQKKKKILMVESDPFLLDIYKIKLEEVGFDFTGLECGEDDFLDKVAVLKPDLICLGVILFKSVGGNTVTKLNGYELIKLLKKDKRTCNIPVVFLTNMSDKSSVEQGMKLGAVDYLIMAEITPKELVEIFIKILSTKKDERPEGEKVIEKTGIKLIIFWFIVGFILGALIF